MAKTTESVQDSTLAQFRHSLGANQHEKLDDYLKQSKEKKEQWLRKNGNLERPKFYREYTKDSLEKIHASIAEDERLKKEILNNSINNTDRHSLLNSALKCFDIETEYNSETLTKYSKTQSILLEDETIYVELIPGRCLSSSMKMSAKIKSLKPYFKKSDNFDKDFQVVQDFRWVEDVMNFTVKYGSLIEFRKSLLYQIRQIVEKYNIRNLNSDEQINENIWQFNF
jgi:hypothetical protein